MIHGVDKNCPVCGTVFHEYPSRPRATCSRTCAARHLRDKGTMIECQECQKQFYQRRSLAEKGYGNFCSKPCWAKSRSLRVERTCVNCQNTFTKDRYSVLHSVNGGRFCSRTCADHFKRALRKRGEQEMFTNWQKREWKGESCLHCGSKNLLELDHIHPRFAGGKATRENAQTLCRHCNLKKFWTVDYPMWDELLLKRQAEC